MLDGREIDSDGSFEAEFDVFVSSFASTVDLLHAPPGFDKVKFVFLASHFLIEGFDCSWLVGEAKTSRDPVDSYSVESVDDVKEIEKMSLKSHLNSMAFADKLTLDTIVQQA